MCRVGYTRWLSPALQPPQRRGLCPRTCRCWMASCYLVWRRLRTRPLRLRSLRSAARTVVTGGVSARADPNRQTNRGRTGRFVRPRCRARDRECALAQGRRSSRTVRPLSTERGLPAAATERGRGQRPSSLDRHRSLTLECPDADSLASVRALSYPTTTRSASWPQLRTRSATPLWTPRRSGVTPGCSPSPKHIPGQDADSQASVLTLTTTRRLREFTTTTTRGLV